jgi:hypothetical protein
MEILTIPFGYVIRAPEGPCSHEMVDCDNNRTQVIIQGSDIYRVAGINGESRQPKTLRTLKLILLAFFYNGFLNESVKN